MQGSRGQTSRRTGFDAKEPVLWYNMSVVTKEKIKEIKQYTTPIFKQYGVIRSSLFGSTARGDDTEKSDVDILVEFTEPVGLFKLAKLRFELEGALNKKVDVLTYRSVYPKLRKFIEKDEVSLL